MTWDEDDMVGEEGEVMDSLLSVPRLVCCQSEWDERGRLSESEVVCKFALDVPKL